MEIMVTRSIARQTICRSSPPARWQSRGFSRGNQLVFVEKRSLRVSATYPFRHPEVLACYCGYLLLEAAPLHSF